MEKRVRRTRDRPSKKAEGTGEGKLEAEEAGRRTSPGYRDPPGGVPGDLLRPARRRRAVERIREVLSVSERRVCKVLGQPRTTRRYEHRPRDDEDELTGRIIDLATRFGRYGYRRITALFKAEGWRVNHKRVERICRREGLRVPSKQPKRGRLWLNDGSCIRLRPEHRNHVWS